ncbi:MAG: hypothetical protein P8Q36_02525 [Alphaproteobacteria bacterium]|jgi:hypothetical protein|nr:hypothetical protein [Rhodospirillaceae bacterium]MBT7612957.1 hypothetical protein [Rhodospirillaceae bacterium]MBT7647209.1 hypothetical protein [Rhodospirillaceae bacterium]MDG2479731.1 hypothetical protein [Alphaproteobacteria bacterium]
MLIRNLLFSAARRVAADPKLQAKAKAVFNENARPVLEEKAREVKQLAAERETGEHPARFAGRAFKRLLDG